MNSRDNYSLSLNHRGAADDIKRGLQKIKLAQIQVLRQLRKQDTEGSRNHSLTYSKESTYDSKPVMKVDPEAASNRQKIQRLQTDIKQYSSKQVKLKRQNNTLAEQAKKYKQISQKAQLKMKEYQKGEEKALAKAQQALSNAISSQKKFVTLKQEYDKTNRQRQRLINQLKRLQKNQITGLLSSHQNQSQIPNKIVKQLISAQQIFTQLMYQVNSHKCFKKDTISNSNGKNTNQFQSTNTFTVSTYETQQKLDRNINNVIAYMKNLHTFSPIGNGRPGSFGNESNNYLQGSFKQDIKNIQEQLDRNSKTKIGEIQSHNKNLQKKLKKVQSELKQYKQQNVIIKNKMKDLSKQLQQIKIDKKILQEQYERYKKRTKEKQKIKEEEIEGLKIKNRSMATLNIEKNYTSVNGNREMQVNQQLLEDRIMDLQKQNILLLDKLNKANSTEQSLKSIIEKLKTQLQSVNSSKKQLQTQLTFQINKLKAKVGIQSNLKNQPQWDQMVRTITMLQQQRSTYRSNQSQLNSRLKLEQQKNRQKVQKMEEELSSMRSLVEQLRKQNAASSFDLTQLTKFRNQQNSTKQSLNFNKKVQQLWGRKEGQYQNVNNVLEQVKPQPHYQYPHQIVRNVPSQTNIMIQQYPNNMVNNLSQYQTVQQISPSNMYLGLNQQVQYYNQAQYPAPLTSYRMNPPTNYILR